jgi:predicted unusual protein kinase regulating ubiquinone biosynthesis (AarF/ABC1/UbiB family)
MTRSALRVRQSRVPQGRIERLARFGWLAGELAIGAVAEGVRRVTGVQAARNLVLTEANAQRLARRLSGLRGAAMKIGQMLSLQGEDILPPEVSAALAVLRADADAMPPAQLRRALGRAYGRGWERRFRHFEPTPVAAASIGQVHRAVAADGRVLALKVQYPGVARSIDSDVENVAAVLRLARLLPGDVDLSDLLAEAKRQLHRETDYRVEAGFQERYRALVAGEDDLVVPGVHDDLTTTHILAMDFIDGTPLDEVCDQASQSVRDRIGAALYRLAFRELFEFRFIQSDPNFANYLFLPASGRIALLDFGGSRDVPSLLATRYGQLFRAALASDRTALRESMAAIGFFAAGEVADRVSALLDLFLIACEPIRHRGRYDFASSPLPSRFRDAALELTLGKGFFRPPPPDTVFLHRKLLGTFLLCARLRARLDVRAVLSAVLDGVAAPPGVLGASMG